MTSPCTADRPVHLADIAGHVVGTFLSLIQAHFSRSPEARAVHGAGDGYRFHAGARHDSTIYLGDQFPETPARGEQRPAIVTRRGRMDWEFTSLGGNLRDVDLASGTVGHSSLMPVALEIQCCSSKGVEAEGLATELFQLVLLMEPDIVRRSRIQQLTRITIGAEEALEIKGARTEWMKVPLTVACMVQAEYARAPNDADVLRGSQQALA